MYIPKHYGIYEYIYPELYEAVRRQDPAKVKYLWMAMDERVLITGDLIREFLDTSITINDYEWNHNDAINFTRSGLRPPIDDPNNPRDQFGGSLVSTHRFGQGADLKFDGNGWKPEALRQYMNKIGCFKPGFKDRTDAEAKPFLLINRVEWRKKKPMSWFHFDVSPFCNNDGSIRIIWV